MHGKAKKMLHLEHAETVRQVPRGFRERTRPAGEALPAVPATTSPKAVRLVRRPGED